MISNGFFLYHHFETLMLKQFEPYINYEFSLLSSSLVCEKQIREISKIAERLLIEIASTVLCFL